MRPELPALAFDDQQPWGACRPGPAIQRRLQWCHRIPPGLSRLVLLLRRPIKYGVHQPLDLEIWGLKLRLMPRGNMSEQKLLFGPARFDTPERELLARRLKPGAVFVDIGANAGVYSFWVWHCLQGQVTILAIEPDEQLRQRLAFNMATNQMQGIRLLPVALSDREGEAVLWVQPKQRGENTLDAATAQAVGGQREARPVTLRTLLDVLVEQRIAQVDALKIDIEGHELPVLTHFYTHAPAALWPRLVIAEVKPETQAAMQQLFEQQGYRLLARSQLNWTYEFPAS